MTKPPRSKIKIRFIDLLCLMFAAQAAKDGKKVRFIHFKELTQKWFEMNNPDVFYGRALKHVNDVQMVSDNLCAAGLVTSSKDTTPTKLGFEVVEKLDKVWENWIVEADFSPVEGFSNAIYFPKQVQGEE